MMSASNWLISQACWTCKVPRWESKNKRPTRFARGFTLRLLLFSLPDSHFARRIFFPPSQGACSQARLILLYIFNTYTGTYILLWVSNGFVSSAFIFASTSSDQICLASSEHFKNFRDGEQRALCKFSLRNLDLSSKKRNVFRQVISAVNSRSVPSMRYTRWTLKEIQSFLIWHCEHITGRSRLKVPYFQVLWHGRFLDILIFLGNLNNYAAFILTSISNFGFDDWQADWLKKIQQNGSFI